MRCNDVQILLATRRDLSLSQRIAVDAHVRSCPACATALLAEERTTRLIQTLPMPIAAPPERVAAAVQHGVTRQMRYQQWGRRVSLAGTMALLLVFGWLLTGVVTGGQPTTLALRLMGALGLVSFEQTSIRPTAPSAYWPGQIYVLSRNTAQPQQALVTILDGATRREHRSFVVDVSSSRAGNDIAAPLSAMALAPDGTRLYLALHSGLPGGDQVIALDSSSGDELWRTTVNGGLRGESDSSIIVAQDGQHIYLRRNPDVPSGSAINSGTTVFQAFDAVSGVATSNTITVTTGFEPSIIVAPNGQSIFVGISTGQVYIFVDRFVTPPAGADLSQRTISLSPDVVLNTAVAEAVRSPDGRWIYAVSADLSVTVIDVAQRVVVREIDLVPRGYFFFDSDLIAFSADGTTLVVGRRQADPDGQVHATELRVFATATWRERGRFTIAERLEGLSLSPDGTQIYAAIGMQSGNKQTTYPDSNGILVAIDSTSGQVERLWSHPDQQIVQVLAGR